MNVFLLYPDRDWASQKSYYDWNGIVKDLGLDTIFELAKSDLVLKGGKVIYVDREDKFLGDTMRKVMRVPLMSKEEILYRQQMVKDCIENKEYVNELYQLTNMVLKEWERLGRRTNASVRDTRSGLVTEIKVLKLLSDGMVEVKELLNSCIENGRFHAEGFLNLNERLKEEYSASLHKQITAILSDLNFYIDTSTSAVKRNEFKSKLPRISFDCGLYDGMKLTDIRLDSIETIEKVFTNPNSIKAKIQGKIDSLDKKTISLYSKPALYDQAVDLEYQAVDYVISCASGVMYEMGRFFDQLNMQIGFYRAAVNLKNKFDRCEMNTCYPLVRENNELSYDDLHEVVMRIEQGIETVGNTGSIDGKMLTIITGANQGGKSTFLRSIGIAQIMMQCGLFVAANKYSSSLYPNFFTHFTRREDSAMNSGRLDEELRRMDNIINHIGERSLILLNESFATTTEKEGSEIAYDISKALVEQGVKIITVTHLLSYAKRVYSEEISGEISGDTGDEIEPGTDIMPDNRADGVLTKKADSNVAFLSAEHRNNGERTYKIIPHEPELTSFGLELYDSVLKSR